MDKDRVAGAAKELKGKIKEQVGKAVGDAKLETDGKSDQFEGKIQNAVGGLKDAMKQKLVAPAELRHWLNQPFLKPVGLEAIQKGASGIWQRIGRLFPSATHEYAQFKMIAIPLTKTGTIK